MFSITYHENINVFVYYFKIGNCVWGGDDCGFFKTQHDSIKVLMILEVGWIHFSSENKKNRIAAKADEWDSARGKEGIKIQTNDTNYFKS